MVKLKFTPHPNGIITQYTGTDNFQPPNADGTPVDIAFQANEVKSVSEEKAAQLLSDFPLNFTVVNGPKTSPVSEEEQFAATSTPNKIGKAGHKK